MWDRAMKACSCEDFSPSSTATCVTRKITIAPVLSPSPRFRLVSSRLVLSRLVSSRLVSSRLVSSRLVSSRLVSSRLVSSRLVSSRLVSSRLVSSRLLSSLCFSSLLFSSLLFSHLLSSSLLSQVSHQARAPHELHTREGRAHAAHGGRAGACTHTHTRPGGRVRQPLLSGG